MLVPGEAAKLGYTTHAMTNLNYLFCTITFDATDNSLSREVTVKPIVTGPKSGLLEHTFGEEDRAHGTSAKGRYAAVGDKALTDDASTT